MSHPPAVEEPIVTRDGSLDTARSPGPVVRLQGPQARIGGHTV
jgi:hypothetical protein